MRGGEVWAAVGGYGKYRCFYTRLVQFFYMTRSLTSFDYRGFTDDPDMLGIPINFLTRPLPSFANLDCPPLAELHAQRDDEPLVPIVHRNIQVLSVYWHAGWDAARPGAWVRTTVAERLARVAENLPHGFSLAVFDAWRPLSLQAEIYQAAYTDPGLPPGFVTPPSDDPYTPPPHLTGGAVDLTLAWNNRPLALGSEFDDFIDEAHADSYEGVPGRIRQLRRLLYWSMAEAGFVVIDCEWWHFELGTRRWAAITGAPVWYSGSAAPAGYGA